MAQKLFQRQLLDEDKAQILHKLVLKQIQDKINEVPRLLEQSVKTAKSSGKKVPETMTALYSFLKKNDYNAYRAIRDLQNEGKTFRRSLGEFLTTDPEFFQQEGLFDVLLSRKPDELFKTLKSFDAKISGEKGGTAFHHQHLSSIKKVLNQVSTGWRSRYKEIAKLGDYILGDEGILATDVAAHKKLSTVDKVVDGVKQKFWNPKGILADMGMEQIPVKGDTVYHRVLNLLSDKGAHGKYAGGTVGFEIAEELGQYSPEDAFKVARPIHDIEKVQGLQAKRIDKLLKHWQGNKSKYSNTEDAFNHLERLLNRIETPNVQPLLKEYEKNLSRIKDWSGWESKHLAKKAKWLGYGLGGLGILGDTLDVLAAPQVITGKTTAQRFEGGARGASGALGFASLATKNPTLGLYSGAISGGLMLGDALVENRKARDKEENERLNILAKGPTNVQANTESGNAEIKPWDQTRWEKAVGIFQRSQRRWDTFINQ